MFQLKAFKSKTLLVARVMQNLEEYYNWVEHVVCCNRGVSPLKTALYVFMCRGKGFGSGVILVQIVIILIESLHF